MSRNINGKTEHFQEYLKEAERKRGGLTKIWNIQENIIAHR